MTRFQKESILATVFMSVTHSTKLPAQQENQPFQIKAGEAMNRGPWNHHTENTMSAMLGEINGSWGDGQKKHEKQDSIKTNQILKMNLVIEL